MKRKAMLLELDKKDWALVMALSKSLEVSRSQVMRWALRCFHARLTGQDTPLGEFMDAVWYEQNRKDRPENGEGRP
jgi:hypothetical protein